MKKIHTYITGRLLNTKYLANPRVLQALNCLQTSDILLSEAFYLGNPPGDLELPSVESKKCPIQKCTTQKN